MQPTDLSVVNHIYVKQFGIDTVYLSYLREHRKALYFTLLGSGKLNEHLIQIDTSACNMADYLIREMAARQGVAEKLKSEDMMR